MFIRDNDTTKNVIESNKLFENNISSRGVWNAKDVAQCLQVSVGHVYNLKFKGLIPYRKRGRLLRFIPSEILDWLNKGDV